MRTEEMTSLRNRLNNFVSENELFNVKINSTIDNVLTQCLLELRNASRHLKTVNNEPENLFIELYEMEILDCKDKGLCKNKIVEYLICYKEGIGVEAKILEKSLGREWCSNDFYILDEFILLTLENIAIEKAISSLN